MVKHNINTIGLERTLSAYLVHHCIYGMLFSYLCKTLKLTGSKIRKLEKKFRMFFFLLFLTKLQINSSKATKIS